MSCPSLEISADSHNIVYVPIYKLFIYFSLSAFSVLQHMEYLQKHFLYVMTIDNWWISYAVQSKHCE